MNVSKKIFNISKPINNYLRLLYKLPQRNFQTSSVFFKREIQETTDGDITVIQGVTTPTDYSKQLQVPGKACPLCRLGLKIRYTDVLVLRQFLTPEGDQLPRSITGLCSNQHKEVRQLVRQAIRAGLMREYQFPDIPPGEKLRSTWKWKRYNVYFEDEDRYRF